MDDQSPNALSNFHTPQQLFVLIEERGPRAISLSEDMAEALADPGVISYAPAVLSVICEWMDLNQTHSFHIRATRDKSYGLNLHSSFLSCLMQLPALASWLRRGVAARFHLDISDQGSDLRLELSRSENRIHHVCVQDHWQTASRVSGDWDETAESLLGCCRGLAKAVADTAFVVDAKILSLTAFREWCIECGCAFDADTGLVL